MNRLERLLGAVVGVYSRLKIFVRFIFARFIFGGRFGVWGVFYSRKGTSWGAPWHLGTVLGPDLTSPRSALSCRGCRSPSAASGLCLGKSSGKSLSERGPPTRRRGALPDPGRWGWAAAWSCPPGKAADRTPSRKKCTRLPWRKPQKLSNYKHRKPINLEITALETLQKPRLTIISVEKTHVYIQLDERKTINKPGDLVWTVSETLQNQFCFFQ